MKRTLLTDLPIQIVLFALVATVPARAQKSDNSPSPLRRLEVVSIKPSNPGAVLQDMRISFSPGRMEAVNITLVELLSSFSGFSGKVQGGPKWVESDRYDIIAKADGEIAPVERNPMVLALLEGRFKLAIHHESKDESGIALVKGGRTPDMEAAPEREQTAIQMNELRQVIFKHVTMPGLAGYLRAMWSTPVVDHTGIHGAYDFSLDPGKFAVDPHDSFSDCLRPAVEELGLKFETVRVTRDITVIDHVERPSEN
ncbi:MAG TPA: TIGR03435 family protein [Candidatus Acidoferrales bacterium]|jgi:uncharacterized protein (TIGR03435 family)|nr:TIGR03435 family protein [Candidatus Acidoferrales bacterium]